MADEKVQIDLLVEATKALLALKNIATGAETAKQKIDMLSREIKNMSTRTGESIKNVSSAFKDVDTSLTGMLSNKEWKEVQRNVDGVGGSVEKTGKAARRSAGDFEILGNRVNIVRTAFGTLLAVGIFQFLNFLSETLRSVIGNLKEAETALFNLVNAEQKLSEQGIDITPKGLDELIKKLQELNPMLSQIQSEELVSSLATKVAPALGLGQKEVEQLSISIALLTVRNMALGKSFDEVMTQVETGILSGKVTAGINQLGVKITDQVVKEKAVAMQLVESAEAYDKLTAAQQENINARAIAQLLIENTNKELENLPEFLKTASAQVGEFGAEWSNLLTTIGKLAGPVIIELFKGWITELEKINEWLEKNKTTIQEIVAVVAGLIRAGGELNEIGEGGFFKRLNSAKNIKEVFQAFKDGYKDAKDSAKELADFDDTPTGGPLLPDSEEDLKNLEDISNKIEDVKTDYENAKADLETKRGQKLLDLDLEYQRKALDAQVDYGRKVEDINRDYERDIAKIKSKQREEDLRAEENYQLKLWELRMRFLMNLEDALHARDARQVIRLQKEYEIDKEALARKQGLDDKQRDADQAAELEDAAIKRDQRLADAKMEYEQKLADQQVAKQRELDDLNTWYARERADLEENISRKLQALIDAGIREGTITEENAANVYGILHKYFGPGGLLDGIYAYMAQKLSTPIPIPMPMFGGGTGPLPYWQMLENQAAASGGGGRRNTNRGGRGMAEGGTLIATRPTTVTFGEAGAEMASFTPLGRLGKNVGTVFSDSGGGLMGQITLAVDLSPDLEARMTKNTMNNVADIVLKVNRSKL